ncbi:MAG: peptidylprolyl isomerase [Spirochaetaceae bacterium]|nr:MAG: peptidylprolyl isomerase [Spirochaetaceae bacterium]
MEITKDTIVTINYTLKDEKGSVLDTSEKKEPLQYLHGYGKMIPGVEKGLEGRKPGDAFDIKVTAEDGYGKYDERLMTSVKKDLIQTDAELAVGMALQAESPEGVHLLYITKIDGDMVSLDGNHPLAGMDLFFNLSVLDVREASPEEKDHGHAHDGDGHHHH